MSTPNKEKNCLDCEHHEIINDNDPEDWFCDDDKAVICKLTPNVDKDTNSIWLADNQNFKCITVSCRPQNLKKESSTPKWCPLKLETSTYN